MPRYEYFLLDVFTKTQFEGNPLAVFPSAQGLTDHDMQRIAGELNLSETVFLFDPSAKKAAAKARIFTPRRELDFAGHPTLGAAYAALLLGLSQEDVADVPPRFVSAGSPLLFISLNSIEAVDRAALQQVHLNEALGSVNSVGTFIFARKEPNSPSNFDVYSRMFAPQTGIPEGPATGGATGPLAAYMQRYGLLPKEQKVRFTSEQGTKMGRRSLLYVRVDIIGAESTIKVGGAVVQVAGGTFSLNDSVSIG